MTGSRFSSIGLHHVGYLVADIADAAVHFGGVFGYSVESDIIDDPVQTARVQFLRQPGGSSWLELIAPIGQGGKLASALAKGGGLHHLCYEVRDIEAACGHFRENRCLMISAPVEARAFPGRRIAWFMDSRRFLFELVEAGKPPLSLENLLGGTR